MSRPSPSMPSPPSLLGECWHHYLVTRAAAGASAAELAGPLADAWRAGVAAAMDAFDSGRMVEARAQLADWIRQQGNAGGCPHGRPYAS